MFCEHSENNNSENEWICSISRFKFSELDVTTDSIYYLPDCGHKFLVEYLDMHIDTSLKNEELGISYLKCPECRRPIFTAPRYQKEIKQAQQRMETLKKKLIEDEEKNRQAAIKIVQGGYASGHWFACKNGHPYFVGECGGAMEFGKCAECGEPIGGMNHQFVEGNTLASEIDGATAPAYPTALQRY